jgi:hypothetical protein
MSLPRDLSAYPLSMYFLSGYLSKFKEGDLNFPPDQPRTFELYEQVFQSALEALSLTREDLRSKEGFNFDDGDAKNLEGGIAMLRVVNALRSERFRNIALLMPPKKVCGADIACERNGQKVCVEAKAITKQSRGRRGCFFEDQLYKKMLETLPHARKQLQATAKELQISVKIFACVVNWFAQSIYLDQGNYQRIVNKLERDQDCASLKGVEGVFFVTRTGQQYLFLNEHGHRMLDQPSELPRSLLI